MSENRTCKIRITAKSECLSIPVMRWGCMRNQNPNIFCLEFGRRTSLDCYRYKKKFIYKMVLFFVLRFTSESWTKMFWFWTDLDNSTYGNGTKVDCPKSEHVRILDIDCTRLSNNAVCWICYGNALEKDLGTSKWPNLLFYSYSIQLTSENGTFGLENRTKFGSDFRRFFVLFLFIFFSRDHFINKKKTFI